MLISELTVYDFFREKINLSDSDARRYAKELALAGEKLHGEIKTEVNEQIALADYATKKDIVQLESKLEKLEARIEAKIEKGFKEVIIWVVGAMVAIGGLTVAIIKLF